MPLDEPRYDGRFSGDVSAKGCIVAKIHDQFAVLKESTRPVEELRFVVHLVQDLNVPLPVGDNKDKGGNQTQVRVFEQGSNMHRLWDCDMVERSGSEEAWLTRVSFASSSEADAAGSMEDRATESLLAARADYQALGGPQRLKFGQ